jgi:hypothetical protein
MQSVQTGFPFRTATADGESGLLAARSHCTAISFVIKHGDYTEGLRLSRICNRDNILAEKKTGREKHTKREEKRHT